MSEKTDYYVYQYICAETGKVLYIGKGRKGRANDIERHYIHCPVLQSHRIIVEIIERGLTEKEALLAERVLIRSYPNEKLYNKVRYKCERVGEIKEIYNRAMFYEDLANGKFESLGDTIKHMRKAIHKKQSEFALLFGLTVNSLSLLENDKSNPTINTLNKLAYAFGLSLRFDKNNKP